MLNKKDPVSSDKLAVIDWLVMLMYSYSLSSNGSLIISQALLGDSGVFQCFASNDAGHAMAATWLRITSKCIVYFALD